MVLLECLSILIIIAVQPILPLLGLLLQTILQYLKYLKDVFFCLHQDQHLLHSPIATVERLGIIGHRLVPQVNAKH